MKRQVMILLRLVCITVTGVALTGCLLRRPTDSTRYFALSPISTNAPAAIETKSSLVEIGFITMPSYLLRNSIVLRNDENEFQYLEDARWGERLDRDFQRTISVNLSRLLPSGSVLPPNSGHGQVAAKVSVNVQQFDVDAHGRGTLDAQWRITVTDNDKPLKSGHAHLVQPGASPRGNPEAIAKTLSDLTTEFSLTLAKEIREFKNLGE